MKELKWSPPLQVLYLGRMLNLNRFTSLLSLHLFLHPLSTKGIGLSMCLVSSEFLFLWPLKLAGFLLVVTSCHPVCFGYLFVMLPSSCFYERSLRLPLNGSQEITQLIESGKSQDKDTTAALHTLRHLRFREWPGLTHLNKKDIKEIPNMALPWRLWERWHAASPNS